MAPAAVAEAEAMAAPTATPADAPAARPAQNPAPPPAPPSVPIQESVATPRAHDDQAQAFGTVAFDEPVTAPSERRPRRNPARYWTMGAIAFALVTAAAGGALWYFGPPAWAVNLGLASNRNEPQLLFYLPRPPERRKLPTNEEYFAFSGRIVNSSDEELPVPPIVVELRDEQGRLVFTWMTKADKARLKPNEEARVSESRLDIPRNARNLSLKFVDGSQ